MNVHLDVLGLVFAHVPASDLVAAAQTSRTWLAGALPRLYAGIEYTQRHAERRDVASPFAALAAHDHLAVHVRRIAVHAAPVSAAHRPCPGFLRDLARALAAASNLAGFVCTAKLVPPLLPHLLGKPRLRHLRLCADLGPRQMAVLLDCAGLGSLALDFPSWNVVDALPRWSAAMHTSLAHLTLFMSQDIDPSVLNATLAQLPRLRGLHVVGCARIAHTAVLNALAHTPALRELSLSIFPTQNTTLPPMHFPLPPLTHLALDIRASYPTLQALIARIINRLSPRDALAVCGGWITEIKTAAEIAAEAPQDTPDPNAPDQADPPLLSPPNFVHGDANSIPGAPVVFGLSVPVPPGDNDGPPGPPNPHLDSDPSSILDALPATLTTLHLPQISSAGLKQVVERCQGLQLLGLVIGNAFASPVKASRITSRSERFQAVRQEICVLGGILARAHVLRELIIATSAIEGPAENPYAPKALFTPLAARTLMRESRSLRRIVGEGRVWESTTPVPTQPAPFPAALAIELTVSKAHYPPGTGNYSHAGSGPRSGAYEHGESSNEHWFWLTGSASGGAIQY